MEENLVWQQKESSDLIAKMKRDHAEEIEALKKKH